MKWKQSETPPQPQSDPLARTPILRKVEEEVTKAFQPFEERLRKIETEANKPIQHSLTIEPNGQQRRRIDRGMNQERIHND